MRRDVCGAADCKAVVASEQVVFHEAALNSVPRSMDAPVMVVDNNVMGMMTLLQASASAKVRRLVYASSSSVYGD